MAFLCSSYSRLYSSSSISLNAGVAAFLRPHSTVTPSPSSASVCFHRRLASTSSPLEKTPSTPSPFAEIIIESIKQRESQKSTLEAIGRSLGVVEPSQWYSVSRRQLEQHEGGRSLLVAYGNSPQQLIASLIDDYAWLPWLFNAVPKGFWHEHANRVAFMQNLQETLRFTSAQDFYKLTKKDFVDHGGSGLLAFYKNSIARAVEDTVAPDDFAPWLFKVSDAFWDSIENQRRYLIWLGKRLGYRRYAHWYRVTKEHFINHFGTGLIQKYSNSPSLLLKSAFPEYPWRVWRFDKVPKMSSMDDLAALVYALEASLHLREASDWLRVSEGQLPFGRAMIRSHGGLSKVVQHFYGIDLTDASFAHKSAQKQLFNVVRAIFPADEVVEDYRPPNLRYASSGQALQLDVFVPRLNLAIEFQGAQHYHATHKGPEAVAAQQAKDKEKARLCKEGAIRLVVLPYWAEISAEFVSRMVRRVL